MEESAARLGPVKVQLETRPRLRKAADVPVLEPRDGGIAEKLEGLTHLLYPFVVSFVVANAASVAAVGAFFGIGWLLMNFVLSSAGIAQWEASVPAWFEDHRTPALNDASYLASMIGHDGLVLLLAIGL